MLTLRFPSATKGDAFWAFSPASAHLLKLRQLDVMQVQSVRAALGSNKLRRASLGGAFRVGNSTRVLVDAAGVRRSAGR